ncbi:DUF721 domain-containing protein [Flammeovirga sp. EKP202]|uniref:DUF721 domain-containing protein n=1 Tax=Flammeovirga sp. EKP202 TaxID=2770592 RepID=UPI00165FF712|nr:DUF721 domain-containing protein [Flammeovirga sp. EKP202]MBD0399837.1 DUF721 domain-containing protein [Flammeovirga sp. EKP202]
MSDDRKIKYRFRKVTPIPKKHETISVAGAMQDFVKSLKKSHSYNQAMIEKVWEDELGTPIASRTMSLKLRGKILYARLSTPTLKNELTMARERIVRKLNRRLGAEVLTDIKFA